MSDTGHTAVTSSHTYRIHERFLTFQGEGIHAGRKAFFIRMYGCPIHCPWCDSAGTWHKDYAPPQVLSMTDEQLAQEVSIAAPSIVVVTGGEPAMLDWTAFTDRMKRREIPVHLETSGAFPIRGDFDWVTLSPKRWRLPIAESIKRANEFKIIVETAADIPYYYALLGDTQKPVWLHPEWSKRSNGAVLGAIIGTVKRLGDPFRAGWQMHKNYKADAMDGRSLPPVPLGGDPGRGY